MKVLSSLQSVMTFSTGSESIYAWGLWQELCNPCEEIIVSNSSEEGESEICAGAQIELWHEKMYEA